MHPTNASDSDSLTTSKVAAEVGVPVWRIRRIVDGLGVELPRAGLYRLIPRTLIPAIRAALARQLATPKEASHA